MHKEIRNDYISGSLTLLFGAVIYGFTLTFPRLPGGHPGPALFPKLIALLLVFFGGILIAQNLWKSRGQTSPGPSNAEPVSRYAVINFILVFVAVALYVALVNWLGFPLTMMMINVLLMRRLGVSWPGSLVVAAAMAIGVYLLFARLLLVPLPTGPIG